ncbi:hypothetical protein CCMA1212_000198 [Trichoderma ghanense]|uniref:F-box domain-containing protein n=1 Tax=Trichoderma ghanense TaxID=65468 RepID=A0ABY2HID5_9HYPO
MTLMVRQSLRRLILGKAKQNPSCAILQLPVEMILLVFEHLPEYERIILAQTCSSLRVIFIDNYKAREDDRHPISSDRLEVDQRSRFLFTMAYRRPNIFGCHLCTKTHRVNQRDTPGSSTVDYKGCRQPFLTGGDFHQGGYTLQYQQAQLALKYTRLLEEEGNGGPVLRRKYKAYLDSLMQPYSKVLASRKKWGMSNEIRGVVVVLPKIVDGRLLMQTVWVFKKSTKDVSPEAIGWLHVCNHLILFAPQQIRDQTRARMLQGPRGALELAIHASFRTGERKFGSCSYCETDFMILASSERTVVRAWQHLGAEAPLVDNGSWKWMTIYSRESLGFHSQPGSIRELYNRDAV